jgi:hypothetical protein
MNHNSEKPNSLNHSPKPSGPVAELLAKHSRAQALKDGRLIDLTGLAKRAGIPVPTAMTAEVQAAYGAPGTDPAAAPGPLWDIVWELQRCLSGRTPCRISRERRRVVRWFDVCVLRAGQPDASASLKAISGSGDHGEPVITIILPDQDWPPHCLHKP